MAVFLTYYRNRSESDTETYKVSSGGDALSINDTGFTNPGYYFIQWNTSSDGTGINVAPGTSTVISGVMVDRLYAIWGPDIEYKTTTSELSSVADAIRLKGGTSSSLTYPTGFVTAIGNIPTGVTPTGSLSISSNGTYDVTNYASAVVNVPQSGMTMTTTQDSHGGDILTITGNVYNGGYTLIENAEYTISHFTTTSATSHATISLGSSAYTSNKIIYVKVRDKAGPRNGYFVGSDAYFFNYFDANSATTTLAVRPIIIFRKSSTGDYTGYAVGSNTGYGVYPYQITSGGVLSIYKRYSSTYSLTIDGTYVVEVYSMDYAPTGGNPFNYNYPTIS